ncbi:hypothetical protein SGFS_029980 [Streptomyces graminofaciens]|uniref:Uncharacterized protein n=1 Tax=Streptomyces graminofaciens TaxID=68212 RepID=A0ABN5VF31_9ACTN|nr:ABC transporter substrate-binding protein [Streptomyces graminofaciens]BBC31704.1 hypothetical protein SGFS_029980 [Streptomyces graminofaciens]
MKNATIGAAVLGGYVLGRTKKAKVALSLGALLAGAKARPGQLGKLLDTPFFSGVTQQVRTELTDASKAAAISVLTAKADSLAEVIHDRTAGLQEKAHGESGKDRSEAEHDEDAEDDEGRAEETAEQEPEEPEEPEARDEEAEDEETDEDEEARGEEEDREDDEQEAQEGDEEEAQGGEGRSGKRRSPARRTSARGGEGRAKAEHRGSDQKSPSRPRKKTAAASRSKSGATAGSRRQGDG